MALKALPLIVVACLLSGCFWIKKEDSQDKVIRLGDLVPLQVSSNQTLIRVSTDEQIILYKDLLNYTTDAELKAQILSRIADLELLYQDQLAEQSEESGQSTYFADYQISIAQYQDLLTAFPERAGNDKIYYQLAKAYDLAGETDNALQTLTTLVKKYPQSTYATEANFRRGDYLFSLKQFNAAGQAFGSVVKAGIETTFYENATYMLAWSLFKQKKYALALSGFRDILDQNLSASGDLSEVLPVKLPMVEDSIRIQAIIFSYIDGVNSLINFYAGQEEKTYILLIYKALGELFEKQERYSDAIKTYRAYIAAYPLSAKAPVFANQVMTVMRDAGFDGRIFNEKEQFIRTYGVKGDYYKTADSELRDYVRGYLYSYMDAAARYYHAKGQDQKERLKHYKSAPPSKVESMQHDYEQAIHYYQLFIATFPDDMHVSEKSYLMAEAYMQVNDVRAAILAYEATAYDFPLSNFSETAAYSSILAYQQMLSRTTEPEEKIVLARKKLQAEMAFIDYFPLSQYVRPIMLATIGTYYKRKDYQKAINQSLAFIKNNPDTKSEERLTLYLVIGHSSFELQNYKTAEDYYSQALSLLNKKDKRYKDIFARAAASIYKQGEILAVAGEKNLAVKQFLRVGQFSPNSTYRKTAEYDAATYLIQDKQWKKAIDLLNEYRLRYDKNKSDLDITGKLIAAYEGINRLDLAAAELKRVHRDEKNPEKRREALYLAAEYYERSGDSEAALAAFRAYSHQYPEPFDLAMETRFRLSEMYRKKGDKNRRKYWLDKIIVSDKKASEQSTARSKYLAAFSRNVFAEDYLAEFNAIKLTMPLSKSLPKKKAAMEAALKRYQYILDYKIQEFSTLATYKVASIYAALSKDMIDSERPSGLNELELEQYDLLLEEQAYPFEEKATEIYESNLENSWHGNYDKWVAESIEALSGLYPAKYNKHEIQGEFNEDIY